MSKETDKERIQQLERQVEALENTLGRIETATAHLYMMIRAGIEMAIAADRLTPAKLKGKESFDEAATELEEHARRLGEIEKQARNAIWPEIGDD